MNKVIYIKCSEEFKNNIKKQALYEMMTESAFIRKVLIRYLKEKGMNFIQITEPVRKLTKFEQRVKRILDEKGIPDIYKDF